MNLENEMLRLKIDNIAKRIQKSKPDSNKRIKLCSLLIINTLRYELLLKSTSIDQKRYAIDNISIAIFFLRDKDVYYEINDSFLSLSKTTLTNLN